MEKEVIPDVQPKKNSSTISNRAFGNPSKFVTKVEKVLPRDGSFTRGCGYPRVPDPTGADTGRKIRLRVRIRAAKSARGQLTGGNLHPRVYPLPATKTRPMYSAQLFLSLTHQDNTLNPRDPAGGPHLAAASPGPRLPPDHPLPLVSRSQAAAHLQVVERRCICCSPSAA
jgi:hypothetical protein